MKNIFLIILILGLSCLTILAQPNLEKDETDRKEKLKSVNIEDGINFDEAEILSSEYFWRYINGCGYAGTPEDEGDYWVSIAHVGYVGQPLKDKIKINKKTGTISIKGYPTIVNPLKTWNVGDDKIPTGR